MLMNCSMRGDFLLRYAGVLDKDAELLDKLQALNFDSPESSHSL
mgnify:CR=1 FL=1